MEELYELGTHVPWFASLSLRAQSECRFARIIHRDNLILAMITGRKPLGRNNWLTDSGDLKLPPDKNNRNWAVSRFR